MSECEKCHGDHFHRTSNGMIVQCECISDEAYDAVNRPAHYAQGDIECIDAIKSAVEGLRGFDAYGTGTVIKYVWRHANKNGVEDLRKARWFLDVMIENTTENSR
tara:strand:+ start:219 stop:533 length:315 start_codon:yes stop_codon:yes gene_type:complete